MAGSGIAFPADNQYFWDLTRAGKGDKAREIYRWFYPLLKLSTRVKFVRYFKLAVQIVGLGTEWVREPRLPLAGKVREDVLAVIDRGTANRPKLSKS